MSDLFLSAEDVAELTGFKRHSAQIGWLQQKHWAFAVRADGYPIVARKEAERQLVTSSSKTIAAVYEPNFAAGRRAG